MKRWLVRLIFPLMLPFLFCQAAPKGRHLVSPKSDPHDRLIPGVIIVKLRPGAALLKGTAVAASTLARLSRRGVLGTRQVFPGEGSAPALHLAPGEKPVDLSRIYYGSIDPAADPRAAAAKVAALPEVEYAEPKYMQTLSDVPNDPQYAPDQSSYLSAMSVEPAWSIVKTNGAVTVADADGGTDWLHEDLLPNIWINAAEDINHNGKFDRGAPPVGDEDGIDQDGDGFVDDVVGWNFANNTNDPKGLSSTPESAFHGTWTASMFGAATNNGTGMAGAGWNPKVMPINCADPTSDNGILYGYEGIAFAANHGARIVNCSWGRLGSFSQFEHDVVRAAMQKGMLVVAAAGNADLNDNDLLQQYPAGYPEVLSVGATSGSSSLVAIFTNVGLSVQVFAPGTGIWGADNGGGYEIAGSGTSFSSPLTAGLASLLFTQHPAWTPRQVATQIRLTADPIDVQNPTLAGKLGHGRVNYLRAVTETHPGLEVSSWSTHTSSGRAYLVTGDTLHLSVTLQNIMFTGASGLQFSVSTNNGSLRALSGPVSIPALPSTQSVTLPDLRFLADTVTNARITKVSLTWTYDVGQQDAYPFPIMVFSSAPKWDLEDTPSGTGLAAVHAVNRGVVWAGGSDQLTTPSVVRTADSGAHWTDVTSNLTNEDVYCIFAVDSSYAWVGTATGRIYATTNGGAHWTLQHYPGAQSPFIDGVWFFDRRNGVAFGDPDTVGGKNYILLKTSDGGATWAHLAGEPAVAAGQASWNNSFWWTDPRHGWFGSNVGYVYRTTDGGATWTRAASGAQNSLGISFADSLHGVAVHDNGLASYTITGGASWTSGQTVSDALYAVALAPGTSIGWATDPVAPFRTSDGGRTWTEETTFPYIGSLSHLTAVDTATAWIATSFGQALKRVGPIDTVGISPIPNPPTPTTFQLYQNYPNPFNASTLLSFDLPESGNASLIVYDMLGRRVRVLVDGALDAGRKSFTFDGSGLASGVYIYRLIANGNKFVRKMVLIR